jgi:hypothetical protein
VAEVLTEPDLVFRHLMARYMDMGFPPQEAEILADLPVDWHYVKEQLIDRGCTIDDAFMILT